MKLLSITLFSLLSFFWMGCTGDPEAVNNAHEHEHTDGHVHHYSCPMHPEVLSQEPGKCPKCKMDLVHSDVDTDNREFFMAWRTEPSEIAAGMPAALYFTPKVRDRDADLVPLDLVHGKKIHLIIVSSDLSYFDHVHPEFQSGGEYKIDAGDEGAVASAGPGNSTTHFPFGGNYSLFADYVPTGASHQLDKIDISVTGSPAPSKTWNKPILTAKDGDMVMTLKPEGDGFFSGQHAHIRAELVRNGKSIKTNELDDFLGAKAHMVIIGTGDMSYLHVHPEESEGVLDMHAEFETPGFYRGWVQFKYQGELHTMSFVIEVMEGGDRTGADQSSDKAEMEHGHKH